MTDLQDGLLKVSAKIWLFLLSFILIVSQGSMFFYWTAVALPLIIIFLNKWSLPAVADNIADEILGTPFSYESRKTADNRSRQLFIVSHRTSMLDAPENTLAGIRRAKEDGAAAVEFDVRFTADDVAVLIHDESVDRTTDGNGLLSDLKYKDIMKFDASVKHFYHAKFKGEKIPTLEEAVDLCLDLGLKIFLEAKDIDERAVKTISQLYKKHPKFYENCVIVSFYPHFLYWLRRTDPNIITVLVWRPYVLSMLSISPYLDECQPKYPNSKMKQLLANIGDYFVAWAVCNLFWRFCGVSAVLIHKSVISQEYLSCWAKAKMRVITWVVNDPFEKEYFSSILGLSYLTDSVPQMNLPQLLSRRSLLENPQPKG